MHDRLVRRPGVARSLRAVGSEGRDGFYRGEFGQGLLALGAGEYVAFGTDEYVAFDTLDDVHRMLFPS